MCIKNLLYVEFLCLFMVTQILQARIHVTCWTQHNKKLHSFTEGRELSHTRIAFTVKLARILAHQSLLAGIVRLVSALRNFAGEAR